MAALLVLLTGAAFTTALAWKPAPPAKFVGLATESVPRTLGGFTSAQDDAVTPEVKAALSSADIISRTYQNGNEALNFVMIGGTDRTALHDPRSCLTGAGWRLESDHTERLPGTHLDVRACHAAGPPDQPGYDIVYLYVVDGRIVNQVTQIRTAMLWSALLGRKNTPVYFLRFMQPLDAAGQTSPADHTRLVQFAAQMWAALSPRLMPAQVKS